MDASEKIEPEENKSQTCDISREQILLKRRQARKIKQKEKALRRQLEALNQKLNKKSEKLQLISPKVFESYRAPKEINNLPNGKVACRAKESFNLLDFVIEKSKQKRNVRKLYGVRSQKFKGKRRENPRKNYTRLKRIILKNRRIKQRKQNTEAEAESKPVELGNVGEEDCQKNTKELEKLNLKDRSENSIHSGVFRPYCDNTTSKVICELTDELLRSLFRFQKNAYEKNEVKGRAHPRFVVGLKEVKQKLRIEKIKLVIFAPDCESCEAKGGIDDTINKMKRNCNEKNIPYMFSLRRRQLGYALFKKTALSCVGILNYDGAQDTFQKLLQCLQEEKDNYLKLTKV